MKLRIFTILILFIIITVIPLRAELVFLNDGSIIEGEIVNDVKESITVKDNDNRLHEIRRINITKISQSIKSGKVYIQKRNGEGISAHIINENKTSYTLRTDLDNPDEFIIKKRDILFISGLSPSNVIGTQESSQISLTWTKPHVSVKHYKVYCSTGKNEKYKLDGITSDNSYILKNVASNKTYYIIVTSIGMDNLESPPSDELVLTTKDISFPQEAVSENKPAHNFNFIFIIKPLYVYPLGGLQDFFDYGYGATLGFSFYKFYSSSFVMSFETGYLRWREDGKNLDSHVYIVPVVFSVGYRFHFTENFSLSALVGVGKAFMSKDCYFLIMGEEKGQPVRTMFTGGMNFDYIFSENFSFLIGGDFFSIYKRDKDKIDKKYKLKNFIEGHTGIAYRVR
ncbi:MAG: hypothetical protein FWF73_03105 [Spirochaetes bacterium]|nr:hypothetical protein [Spirochaetota bacterium]